MFEQYNPELLWAQAKECLEELGLDPDDVVERAYIAMSEAHTKHATGIREAHEEESNDWMFADEV